MQRRSTWWEHIIHEGEGIAQNFAEAFKWFVFESSETRICRCGSGCSWSLFSRRRVEQDFEKANEWTLKAISRGFNPSEEYSWGFGSLKEVLSKKWQTSQQFYSVKENGGTGDGENQDPAADGGRRKSQDDGGTEGAF